MGRCWNPSQHRLEEAHGTDGDPAVASQLHFPHKAFWPILTVLLLLFILVFGVTGHFRSSHPPPQSQQTVRLSVPESSGFVINQSAVVDWQKDIVTFNIVSAVNQTSTVLFDTGQGLICYKPANQRVCFLQKMEESDYDNVRSFLREPRHKAQCHLIVNETLRQTEFLGVMGSNPVDVSTLEEPLQHLCRDRTVHWTHKTDGPAKQRLVYFCIDICFPSNICVSVCFYYLPE